MLRMMTLSLLALSAACAAQARTEAAPAPAPAARIEAQAPASAACDIRETRTSQGLRLEAVVHARTALRAEYGFSVEAKGSGGTSNVTQGGPFEAAAGVSTTVGAVDISRGRYRATLTVRDADGEICRLERRS